MLFAPHCFLSVYFEAIGQENTRCRITSNLHRMRKPVPSGETGSDVGQDQGSIVGDLLMIYLECVSTAINDRPMSV